MPLWVFSSAVTLSFQDQPQMRPQIQCHAPARINPCVSSTAMTPTVGSGARGDSHGPPVKRQRLLDQKRHSSQQPRLIAGYRIGTYAAPSKQLTLAEQTAVYHAWLGAFSVSFLCWLFLLGADGETTSEAGAPHNHACYTCRTAGGALLECITCCRSYHLACAHSFRTADSPFQCPACKGRGWDEAPPPYINTPTPRAASSILAKGELSSQSNQRADIDLTANTRTSGVAVRSDKDTVDQWRNDFVAESSESQASLPGSRSHLPSAPEGSASVTAKPQGKARDMVARIRDLEATVSSQRAELCRAEKELRTKSDILANIRNITDEMHDFKANISRLKELLQDPNG